MFDLPKNKIIYVSCSGGIDSSLLLFELTKFNKDRDIRPVVYNTDNLPLYRKKEKVEKIINLISDLNNYKFQNVYYRDAIGNSPRQEDFIEFFKEEEVGFIVLGITKNPNIKFKHDKDKDNSRSEDGKYVCENGEVLESNETPYANLHKRDIALKYYDYNLHNNLFPLTFSCTANTEIHCGDCWWCEERMWGFGRLI